MNNFLRIIIGLGVLIGFIYLTIWTLKNIPNFWAPFIAAGFGFLVSRIYEAYKENKARLYDKKREVYVNLLMPWKNILIGTMLREDKSKEVEASKEMIEFAANAAFDAILYASDEVVKDYGAFRNIHLVKNAPPELIFKRLSKLFKSMRNDLGHSFSTLNDLDLLIMFINLTDEEIVRYKNLSDNLK